MLFFLLYKLQSRLFSTLSIKRIEYETIVKTQIQGVEIYYR